MFLSLSNLFHCRPAQSANLTSATLLWSLVTKTVLPTTKQRVQEPRWTLSRPLCSASMQQTTPSPQSKVSTRNHNTWAKGRWADMCGLPGTAGLPTSAVPPSPPPPGCPALPPRGTARHGAGWPHRLPGRAAPLAALLHEPPAARLRQSHLPAPGRAAAPQGSLTCRGRNKLTETSVRAQFSLPFLLNVNFPAE